MIECNPPCPAIATAGIGRVAQLAEQWPFKPLVEGSSPSALTDQVLLREDFLLQVFI